MILRTLANTRLILQSGSGGHGILIDANNYVYFKRLLSFTIGAKTDCENRNQKITIMSMRMIRTTKIASGPRLLGLESQECFG